MIRLGFEADIASLALQDVPKSNHQEEKTKLAKDLQLTKRRLSKKYRGKELKEKLIATLLRKGYRLNDVIKEME